MTVWILFYGYYTIMLYNHCWGKPVTWKFYSFIVGGSFKFCSMSCQLKDTEFMLNCWVFLSRIELKTILKPSYSMGQHSPFKQEFSDEVASVFQSLSTSRATLQTNQNRAVFKLNLLISCNSRKKVDSSLCLAQQSWRDNCNKYPCCCSVSHLQLGEMLTRSIMPGGDSICYLQTAGSIWLWPMANHSNISLQM